MISSSYFLTRLPETLTSMSRTLSVRDEASGSFRTNFRVPGRAGLARPGLGRDYDHHFI